MEILPGATVERLIPHFSVKANYCQFFQMDFFLVFIFSFFRVRMRMKDVKEGGGV